MTTHIDRIPSQEHFDSRDYRERLQREAEEILFHPSLAHLLTVAAEEHNISEASIEALANTPDTYTYALTVAKLAKTILDRREGSGIERHQLRDDDLSSRMRETIRRTVNELHMTTETPVPSGSFEIAAVLGATVAPIAKRTDYLYDALEAGTANTSILIGLGAERRLLDVDTKYAHLYPYVSAAEVETELLAHAAQDWFTKNGYTAPVIDRSAPIETFTKDATLGSSHRIQTVTFEDEQSRPGWAPGMIINLSAPFQKTHHPRANTGETVRFLLALADLAPGDRLLFVSSQPYLLGQKFEIQRLCLEAGVEVEVAGYGIDSARLSASALGDEIAKATAKAAALYTALR